MIPAMMEWVNNDKKDEFVICRFMCGGGAFRIEVLERSFKVPSWT